MSTIGTPKQRTAFRKLISDNLLATVPKIYLNAKSFLGRIPIRIIHEAPLQVVGPNDRITKRKHTSKLGRPELSDSVETVRNQEASSIAKIPTSRVEIATTNQERPTEATLAPKTNCRVLVHKTPKCLGTMLRSRSILNPESQV